MGVTLKNVAAGDFSNAWSGSRCSSRIFHGVEVGDNVITLIINGLSRESSLINLVNGVITHLQTGMNHQVM